MFRTPLWLATMCGRGGLCVSVILQAMQTGTFTGYKLETRQRASASPLLKFGLF